MQVFQSLFRSMARKPEVLQSIVDVSETVASAGYETQLGQHMATYGTLDTSDT